jgi:hypothetical protein
VCRRAHVFLYFLCMSRYAMSNILSCHMSLCSQFRYDFRIKLCSVRFYLKLFVGELIYYLLYLCLLAHSGVQQILTTWVPWRVSQDRTELITLRRRLGSYRFLVGSVLLIFLVLSIYIYIYIYIYVWKLNQTVLELDFRAVKFLFFRRRDLNPHHCYTAAPFA